MTAALAAASRAGAVFRSRPRSFTRRLRRLSAEPLLKDAFDTDVPPKPVYFSGLMSRFGVSGVYSPFTGEPNYNTLQPDCDLPFAVAHEMAHQRGYARSASSAASRPNATAT